MRHVKKALFMMFLVLTIPLFLPVTLADHELSQVNNPNPDPEPTPPGQQCIDANTHGEDFVDAMDNGIIKTLEAVAAALFAVATVVNTIDSILNTLGLLIGHSGGGPGSQCCFSVFGNAGACQANSGGFSAWKKIKTALGPLVAIGSCNYGGETPGVDLTNGICNQKPNRAPSGVATTSDGNAGTNGAQDFSPYNQGTFSALHLSPFDNIILAVGCLCPVAILHNLRKLKTIYQVNNCCVEQACSNGITTESCSAQLDEAICLYLEGAVYKMLLKVIASIVAGFIYKIVLDLIEESVLGVIASCVLLFYQLIQIPAKFEALAFAFSWFSVSFDEPSCEDLGFDQIETNHHSGFTSLSAGVNDLTTSPATGYILDPVAVEDANKVRSGEISETQRYEFNTVEGNTVLTVFSETGILGLDTEKRHYVRQNNDWVQADPETGKPVANGNRFVDPKEGNAESLANKQQKFVDANSKIEEDKEDVVGRVQNLGVSADDQARIDAVERDLFNAEEKLGGAGLQVVQEGVVNVNGVLVTIGEEGEIINFQTEEPITIDDKDVSDALDAYGNAVREKRLLRIDNVIPEDSYEGIITHVDTKINDVIKKLNDNDNVKVINPVTIDVSGIQYELKDDKWVNELGEELTDTTVISQLNELKNLNNLRKDVDTAYTADREKYYEEYLTAQTAYQLTWEVLNFVLDEFAFPAVDEMCKEDWRSSEPVDDEPLSESVSAPSVPQNIAQDLDPGSLGQGVEYAPPSCADQYHGEIVETGEGYQISYGISACTRDLTFTVSLKGDAAPENNIFTPTNSVRKGTVFSDATTITGLPAGVYTSICIRTSTSAQCFP